MATLGLLVAVEAIVKIAVQSRWSVAIRASCKEVACAALRVAIKVGFKDAARLGLLFAIMASAFEGRLLIIILAYFEKRVPRRCVAGRGRDPDTCPVIDIAVPIGIFQNFFYRESL